MTSTTSRMTLESRVAVVGGGAAGLMAAGYAAQLGAAVTLFERGEKPGKKLAITGKGRCNLTCDCDTQTFLANVPTNPRFLYTALSRTSPQELMEIFEALGVPLKVERGQRVFPVSDKAGDIVAALVRYCAEGGVEMRRERVSSLWLEDGRLRGVKTGGGSYPFDRVIVCTGGLSYPKTGSDGDGYDMARAAGHTIVPPSPSLVPLEESGHVCRDMMGLSLRNVTLKIVTADSGKCVFEDFGELLCTHFGLSGPMALSASAHLRGITPGMYRAVIDFKPALDDAELDRRILSDFAKYVNRDFGNALSDLLPQKAIAPMIAASGIDPRKKVNLITQAERRALAGAVKGFTVPLRGFRPIDEAIVTSGGVNTREIDPKTMKSKILDGLFFAGEVIDVDAYTGGFNLHIAFATARLSATACAGPL